jgi:hypothetical protein
MLECLLKYTDSTQNGQVILKGLLKGGRRHLLPGWGARGPSVIHLNIKAFRLSQMGRGDRGGGVGGPDFSPP